jgi:hypothetical protein
MDTLRNKNLYKVFLSIVKYIPNVLALCKIVGLFLNFLKIKSFLLTCFGGTSLLFLVLLYLISYIFRFCGTYRLSLHYVTLIHIITMVDYYIGIPLSLEGIYTLYTIVSGVFITSWIIIWYKNKNNPKIDHIKQLCDSYSDCGC